MAQYASDNMNVQSQIRFGSECVLIYTDVKQFIRDAAPITVEQVVYLSFVGEPNITASSPNSDCVYLSAILAQRITN